MRFLIFILLFALVACELFARENIVKEDEEDESNTNTDNGDINVALDSGSGSGETEKEEDAKKKSEIEEGENAKSSSKINGDIQESNTVNIGESNVKDFRPRDMALRESAIGDLPINNSNIDIDHDNKNNTQSFNIAVNDTNYLPTNSNYTFNTAPSINSAINAASDTNDYLPKLSNSEFTAQKFDIDTGVSNNTNLLPANINTANINTPENNVMLPNVTETTADYLFTTNNNKVTANNLPAPQKNVTDTIANYLPSSKNNVTEITANYLPSTINKEPISYNLPSPKNNVTEFTANYLPTTDNSELIGNYLPVPKNNVTEIAGNYLPATDNNEPTENSLLAPKKNVTEFTANKLLSSKNNVTELTGNYIPATDNNEPTENSLLAPKKNVSEFTANKLLSSENNVTELTGNYIPADNNTISNSIDIGTTNALRGTDNVVNSTTENNFPFNITSTNSTKPEHVTTENASKRGRFLKGVKPIGKMETLEIKMSGKTSTKNNFTKINGGKSEGEKGIDTSHSRLDFIKVRKQPNKAHMMQVKSDRKQTRSVMAASDVAHTKRHHHRRHHLRKRHRHNKHKKHNHQYQVNNKKQQQQFKRSNFPKTSFYHPTSSEFDNIYEHRKAFKNHIPYFKYSVPYQRNYIVYPWHQHYLYEQPQQNIKRSRIEHVVTQPRNHLTSKLDDDDNDDDEEDESESSSNEQNEKRSETSTKPQNHQQIIATKKTSTINNNLVPKKVEEEGTKRTTVAINSRKTFTPSPLRERKYSIKGYNDNIKVLPQSSEDAAKKSNTKIKGSEMGAKKSRNPVEMKARKETDDKLKNYKSPIFPGDEVAHSPLKDFIREMTSAPFAPNESPLLPVVDYKTKGEKTKPPQTLKDQYKASKGYKDSFKEMQITPAIMKNKNNLLKPKNDKYASAAMKDNKKEKEEDDDEDDEEEEEEDAIKDEGDNDKNQNNKDDRKKGDKNEEAKEDEENEMDDGDNDNEEDRVNPIPQTNKQTPNPGIPPPVQNDHKNAPVNLPAKDGDQNLPDSTEMLPSSPEVLPTGDSHNGPPVQQDKPTSTLEISNPEPNIDAPGSPILSAPVPIINAPSPPVESIDPLRLKMEENIANKLEENSENINSLYEKVNDLENKEAELERAMGDIGNGLERIEQKLDLQQQNNKVMKAHPMFVNEQLAMPSSTSLSQKGKPHILKQIFIPLPPKNSEAAKEIKAGAPLSSPALNFLPFPIRMLVSKIFRQQLNKEEQKANEGLPMHSSIEPDAPAQEHDIDRLELELGRVPITRHRTVFPSQFDSRVVSTNNNMNSNKPKIIFFSRSVPAFLDLFEKPCNVHCQNGGRCLGYNVCRCPHEYTGRRCEISQFQTRPTIVEIIRPAKPVLPSNFDDAEFVPKKSHKISLPFVLSESDANDDDEEEKQSILGHVDQRKLVNILRKFTMPLFRRSDIPNQDQQRYIRRN